LFMILRRKRWAGLRRGTRNLIPKPDFHLIYTPDSRLKPVLF
jgi:hypothetical protein